MNNKTLLAELKSAVAREREITALVLGYLQEVETRRIYLEEGFPSLFEFCVGYLGYNSGEVQTRIQAMRLNKKHPEVAKKIESGELSLTVASRAQSVFHRHQAPPEKQATLLAELTGATSRAADKILAREFPEEIRPERERTVTETHTEVRFTASGELMKKFERLKELLAHKNFSGRYDVLFEELAEIALEKLEPKPPKSDAPQLPAQKVSRYIPVETRRQVFRRGGCEFVSPSGKRCNSRHGVQFDHIVNFSEGGTSAPENLQLLCGAHNRWKYERGS